MLIRLFIKLQVGISGPAGSSPARAGADGRWVYILAFLVYTWNLLNPSLLCIASFCLGKLLLLAGLSRGYTRTSTRCYQRRESPPRVKTRRECS